MAKLTETVKDVTTIQDWITAWVARELALPITDIDLQEPFVNFGLSSRQAVFLTGELEDWLGHSLDPAIAWDYPTIEKLATYLAGLAD